ncbi:hypothetical protein SERLA73DRAFT_188970 [Serpula lacrymans var. lacrymans S7.3]|uniref:T6SS Phospholipase effector Tle1-like catalytic domain-containing protein n=2 Tax=Serpula lacrymans var. lacrymans TaxID=341189 RepID=F8QCJ4_SERL3|nr:uncharacterized protein SERLADRAFT_479593 [Serpula lacrymans var. lacrymans S7.9]EGN93859.1 hypothetical protein SERLA73DRAFT_188970 [Serpula lacrymans var. lacrymans S7.3]EGO19226.1 hypothetical protein SERLADRAFT_479593 [Serpula lacrymans var. lacrymans S7.9]
MDDIIPETHEHRTLVLCFDGTGDQFDADNSNIIQFFSMLKKDDMSQQMVYYQAGIGTYTIPEIATPFMAGLSKTWDMMVGVHLNAHVMGGYEFLMQNYQAGDKICIFGFSRGAYTARALAGMIHKVGLLPVCNHQQVPFAYNMYSRDDETGWKQSTAFKRAFSINVEIEFVGVWDTVSAVGLIPRRLPFTKVSDNIKYFRHAISLDEHRARFNPNTWSHPTEKDKELGVKRHEMPRSKKVHHKANLHDLERRYSEDTDTTTDVEEVWFSGCHTDVGGGSVVNGTRYSLARIPLRWMLRQCFLAKTGILFHKSIFPKVGLDPDRLYPEVLPRPPPLYQSPACRSPPLKVPWVVTDDRTMVTYSDGGEFVNEEDEDLADALSPHYDQLVLLKGWWILEVLPQKNHYQKDNDNSWTQEYQINMGAGRHIPRQKKDGVKFHRTVKIRMEAEGLKDGKYWPKAKLKVEPKWVD